MGIPVVGSVMNWWSPVEKKVAGKSFDIGSTALRSVMLSPSSKDNTPRSSSSPVREGTAAPIPLSEDPRTSAELSTPPRRLSSESPRRMSEDIPQPLIGQQDDIDDLPRPEPLPLPDDE